MVKRSRNQRKRDQERLESIRKDVEAEQMLIGLKKMAERQEKKQEEETKSQVKMEMEKWLAMQVAPVTPPNMSKKDEE
eukprot:1086538-Karenia_brevis.AAC.1